MPATHPECKAGAGREGEIAAAGETAGGKEMGSNTGKKLEETVYATLRTLLAKGELGVLPGCGKVFRGKGYDSREREAAIITDVSLELFVAGGDTPSILWIWECKDYQRPVPVGDVEEFHAKLSQIGSDNTKGTIITSRGAFQPGALKYAKAKGIGLARILPREQIRWISYQMSAEQYAVHAQRQAYKALTEPDCVADEMGFFSLSGDAVLSHDTFPELIHAAFAQMKKQ